MRATYDMAPLTQHEIFPEQFHLEIAPASARADARHAGASAIYLRGKRRSGRGQKDLRMENVKVILL